MAGFLDPTLDGVFRGNSKCLFISFRKSSILNMTGFLPWIHLEKLSPLSILIFKIYCQSNVPKKDLCDSFPSIDS